MFNEIVFFSLWIVGRTVKVLSSFYDLNTMMFLFLDWFLVTQPHIASFPILQKLWIFNSSQLSVLQGNSPHLSQSASTPCSIQGAQPWLKTHHRTVSRQCMGHLMTPGSGRTTPERSLPAWHSVPILVILVIQWTGNKEVTTLWVGNFQICQMRNK